MGDSWNESSYGGRRGNGGERRGPREPRPGDWMCDCGQSNFASRSECFKCSEPRPEGMGGGDQRPRREARPDDWACPADGCGFKTNFGSRSECFRCGGSKPAHLGGGEGRPRREARPDDWACPDESCGYRTNFGSRTECFKCHAPKPVGQDPYDAGGDYDGGAPAQDAWD